MKTYIKKNILALICSIACSTASASIGIILAFSMGNLTNGAVNHDIAYLFQQGVRSIICLVVILILDLLNAYFKKLFSKKCLVLLKSDIYNHMLKATLPILKNKEESYYLNLLQSDTDIIYRDYFSNLDLVIGYALKIIISIAALFFVSVKIFVIFLLSG